MAVKDSSGPAATTLLQVLVLIGITATSCLIDVTRLPGLSATLGAAARSADTIEQYYGSILSDPSAWVYFWGSQLAHATVNDTFPTLPFLRLTPLLTFYKLDPCERKDLGKCLQYGNSSNGLPERLQGIFWQEGVQQPEVAISTAGTWDATTRTLTLRPSVEPMWAFNYTSAVKSSDGLWWLPSGATHFNGFQIEAVQVDVVFNEDISFGQIYISLWNLPIRIPPIIVNWTMSYLPDGSWLRESAALGTPTPIGRYYLRKAIDGKGQPGPYFNQWLKADGGIPFGHLRRVFP